jgi:hypothetical protein
VSTFVCFQGYVVVPSDMRFLLLFTFLKKNMKKKVIVFLSSCNSVKYHAELLNYIDIPVLELHVRSPSLPLAISLSLSLSQFNNKSRDDHLIATCPIIS